jgi:lipopolysaccharide export system ATP-binding protein
VADVHTGTGLVVSAVAKRFGRVSVLESVSLTARPGTITALLGPNGAGKSTLFHIVMGLVSADAGTAEIDGQQLLALPLHKKHAAGLGFLSQTSASFPELTVRENLLALLELFPLPRDERNHRLENLLERMGLKPLEDRRYGLLSGGEQRRLEIAKALTAKPRMLLLDEPFAGLDPFIVEGLSKTIRALAAEGVGVLLTDHNVYVTLAFVDHAYFLAGGRIICEGTPAELSANTVVRSQYLGAGFAPTTAIANGSEALMHDQERE